ncbi:MAG TPA: hypothetical protein VE596_10955 [Gaiellaceae bacterium]|nr:hypothetical protein [Gaiellaceae bacterium]
MKYKQPSKAIAEILRALDTIERDVADVRKQVRALIVNGIPPPNVESEDPEMDRWDELDRNRRRQPEWERRGRLMNALEQAGGDVSVEEWRALAAEAGYRSAREANGFFAGTPAVIERDIDRVRITQRGRSAARFWRNYWQPRVSQSGQNSIRH